MDFCIKRAYMQYICALLVYSYADSFPEAYFTQKPVFVEKGKSVAKGKDF